MSLFFVSVTPSRQEANEKKTRTTRSARTAEVEKASAYFSSTNKLYNEIDMDKHVFQKSQVCTVSFRLLVGLATKS